MREYLWLLLASSSLFRRNITIHSHVPPFLILILVFGFHFSGPTLLVPDPADLSIVPGDGIAQRCFHRAGVNGKGREFKLRGGVWKQGHDIRHDVDKDAIG